MKKLSIIIIAIAFSCNLWSQTSREEIRQNINLAASNYLAYPAPTKKLTPNPKGKKPFYISHYGRHGSRYLIDRNDYYSTLDILRKADTEGKLTEKGRETLRKIQMMCIESNNRYGELTELGAQQHRQIARRMYERFPQVFQNNATIDAKSTVVIRCILSMESELQELIRLNPKLKIKHDASEHDMYYMNFDDKELTDRRHNDATKAYIDKWSKENINPTRVMSRLFNDEEYIRKNVKSRDLYSKLFRLACIIQNSELRRSISLFNIFDEQDIFSLWQQHNIGWFCEFGSNELNGGTQPFTQRNLLRKIIEEADSCIALKHPGATLRFGHETMVLPLTCLLDINGYGKTMHPSQLEDNQWYNYRIFPMGCNIQFIFYRKNLSDKDVWVKVLLNEEEAALPIAHVQGTYYRWNDIKKYYIDKLNAYKQ
jgi:hypothetical protein